MGRELLGTIPAPFLGSCHTVQKSPSLKVGDRGPGTGTTQISSRGSPRYPGLAEPCPPYPAARGIRCPGSVLEEAGAAAGHSEEPDQEARPACALVAARVAHRGRSVQWVVVGEPETRAAKWMAVEVVEDPGTRMPTGNLGAPGRGQPCPNLCEKEDQSPKHRISTPHSCHGHDWDTFLT